MVKRSASCSWTTNECWQGELPTRVIVRRHCATSCQGSRGWPSPCAAPTVLQWQVEMEDIMWGTLKYLYWSILLRYTRRSNWALMKEARASNLKHSIRPVLPSPFHSFSEIDNKTDQRGSKVFRFHLNAKHFILSQILSVLAIYLQNVFTKCVGDCIFYTWQLGRVNLKMLILCENALRLLLFSYRFPNVLHPHRNAETP